MQLFLLPILPPVGLPASDTFKHLALSPLCKVTPKSKVAGRLFSC